MKFSSKVVKFSPSTFQPGQVKWIANYCGNDTKWIKRQTVGIAEGDRGIDGWTSFSCQIHRWITNVWLLTVPFASCSFSFRPPQFIFSLASFSFSFLPILHFFFTLLLKQPCYGICGKRKKGRKNVNMEMFLRPKGWKMSKSGRTK